jgi:hypothetical protein
MKKVPGWLDEMQHRRESDWEEPEKMQPDPSNLPDKSGNVLHDSGSVPTKGGAVRGDQQALNTDSNFGGFPKGTKHRGRS